MKFFDQIVIGAGASGLTFLHSALHGTQLKFVRKSTLLIGKGSEQLWARIGGQNPQHAMGQPAHLLNPSGMPIPNGAPTRTQVGPVDFLETQQYNATLANLSQQIDKDRRAMNPPLPILSRLEDDVTSITPKQGGYYVTTASHQNEFNTRNFETKQVIIACGPGMKSTSLQTVPTDKPKLKGDLNAAAKTGEYLDAVDYICNKQPEQRVVLIYGGSATASWAAAHACASHALAIGWANRKGPSQIKTEGNPIGRNDSIIQTAEARGWFIEDLIEEITFHGERPPFQRRLEVKFKNTGNVLEVDQLVYALGADPVGALGPGAILSQQIKNRIEPVWDNCYRFVKENDSPTGVPNKVAIALKDTGGDLWVVGASVFRGLGIDAVRTLIGGTGPDSKYALAGSILPSGGRPPEGIAILDATIRAVTGFRQTNDATFNWNTANRRDIFMLLARTYAMEIPYTTRENMADEIVQERATTTTGFTMEYLFAFLDMLKRDHDLQIDVRKLPGLWNFQGNPMRPLPSRRPPLPPRTNSPVLPMLPIAQLPQRRGAPAVPPGAPPLPHRL